MFIIAQRKKSVVLLAMMIQMPAYGITEFQAKIGTALAGTLTLAGAAVISDGENLGLIGLTGAGVGALAHRYLMSCTPKARLKHINLELDKITAQGYGNCWIPEGDELKPFVQHEALFKSDELKPRLGQKDYEDLIFQIRKDSIGNAEHSLAVAYEEMIPLHAVISTCDSLLKSIQNDADADSLSHLWDATYNRCENYSHELKTVDMWIREHSTFAAENQSYRKWKVESEQLKINKQKADARTKKAVAATIAAQAQMKKAQAQDKKADAVQSYTTLQWLKAFWSWFFGKKWN